MNEGVEDTYTPSEAARLLKLTAHRVRQMIHADELEGWQDERGHWHIPQREVHALLEERPRRNRGRRGEGDADGEDREPVEGSATGERLWELEEELKRLHREVGRMEGRLELTQVAESTLRESLERERRRADQERERAERLELEAQQLRERLARASAHPEGGQEPQAPSEAPTSLPTATAGQERVEAPASRSGPQTPTRRRPWWRRFLGGA